MESMIRNWKTKRSGARMTITGTDLSGAPVKVGVDEITAAAQHGGFPRATDKKSGASYLLA